MAARQKSKTFVIGLLVLCFALTAMARSWSNVLAENNPNTPDSTARPIEVIIKAVQPTAIPPTVSQSAVLTTTVTLSPTHTLTGTLTSTLTFTATLTHTPTATATKTLTLTETAVTSSTSMLPTAVPTKSPEVTTIGPETQLPGSVTPAVEKQTEQPSPTDTLVRLAAAAPTPTPAMPLSTVMPQTIIHTPVMAPATPPSTVPPATPIESKLLLPTITAIPNANATKNVDKAQTSVAKSPTPTAITSSTPVPTITATGSYTLTATIAATEIILPLRIEAESTAVQQSGKWAVQSTVSASAGHYLLSSGAVTDNLSFVFLGTSLDIIYIKDVMLGSFVVEIDGQNRLIVYARAKPVVYSAVAQIRKLASGVHTARIYPASGVIAIDAFAVNRPAKPEITAISTATAAVPSQTLMAADATATTVPTMTVATIATQAAAASFTPTAGSPSATETMALTNTSTSIATIAVTNSLTVISDSTTTPTLTPSGTPTLALTPDGTTTSTLTPSGTPTSTLTATSTGTNSPLIQLSGQVKLLTAEPLVMVTVVGNGIQKTINAQSDGTFVMALLPGNYRFIVTASCHLPYMTNIVLTDQPLALPVVTLVAGDINGDGAIDYKDVQIVTINFSQKVSAANRPADVNGDGIIDIYDLVIVSANMGTTN